MKRFAQQPLIAAKPGAAKTALLGSLALLLAGCASLTGAPATGGATTAATAATAASAAKPKAAPASTAVAATKPPAAAAAPAAAASGPQAAARPGPAASGASPNAAAARPPTPGAPPPFATVTKDAKRVDGFLPLWTKDEKTWLEIPAKMLDKPFFLGSSLATGLGERFFYPGLMHNEQIVSLRREGNMVQLVARNMHARGPLNTPLARAIRESYSDSLLAAMPMASAPHEDSKALLVDAYALLGGDLPGALTQLETMYRLPYALDRSNSSIVEATTQAEGTHITVRSHFAIQKLPARPVTAPGAPPPNPAGLPNPPTVVPDARSLFLGFAYTLAPLPEQPMAVRRADPRVGYFTESFVDFANDAGGDRRTHLINRWRLEKKDPAAEVSEPKTPIRVVMDRNIPEKWRAPVRAGILEWNQAFERAGFRNAIAVEQQADDATWSTMTGIRMLSVRWFALEGPGATAVGRSQVDPRTGEILRGASIIPENWVRIDRTRVGDTQPRLATVDAWAATAATARGHGHGHGETDHDARCTLAEDALVQADFAFALLAERGELDPTGPEAERFIADSLKDVTMHEVGHALGLRHNFKASTGVTRAQLRDAAFTSARGVSNSVMDYNAINLSLDGEAKASMQMATLGAYDYWAVEYGYRQYPPELEVQALATLAGRGEREPDLAYATDEDAAGPDPEANRFDLGDDPLAFATRQLKLSRELWQRTATRTLRADDDMAIYRRNLQRMLAGVNSVVPLATRYVGGLHTRRATAGSGQALLTPVDGPRQREALDLVVGELFNSASFKFDPLLMSRLGVDQLDRVGRNRFQTDTDFSVSEEALKIQRRALDALMNDALAARLADAEVKVFEPRTLMSYAEVQRRLQDAIWSELSAEPAARGGRRDVDTLRRNLQRDHLRRLASGMLRSAHPQTADVPSVHRFQALALQAKLKAAVAAPGWSDMALAHLTDSLAVLGEALRAPLLRQGI